MIGPRQNQWWKVHLLIYCTVCFMLLLYVIGYRYYITKYNNLIKNNALLKNITMVPNLLACDLLQKNTNLQQRFF